MSDKPILAGPLATYDSRALFERFKAGARARRRGEPLTAVPVETDPEHTAWVVGWEWQEQQINALPGPDAQVRIYALLKGD